MPFKLFVSHIHEKPHKGKIYLNTSNDQRLGRVGDNDRRSKHFCSNAVLCIKVEKTHVIRVQGVEARNAHDQIAFCVFHSFFVDVQTMLATYMRRMHNFNLKIRIVGSSCCLQ